MQYIFFDQMIMLSLILGSSNEENTIGIIYSD